MIRLADLIVPYWSDPLMGTSETSPHLTAFNSHMTPAQYNEEQETQQ